jgi:ABC-2 type transport system permease protein
MTYASEMMRGALTPSVPHIAPWICLVVLLGAIAVLLTTGVRGFYKRAMD